jgi:hypothetical protein
MKLLRFIEIRYFDQDSLEMFIPTITAYSLVVCDRLSVLKNDATFRSVSFLKFQQECESVQSPFDLVIGDVEAHVAYEQDYLTPER